MRLVLTFLGLVLLNVMVRLTAFAAVLYVLIHQ